MTAGPRAIHGDSLPSVAGAEPAAVIVAFEHVLANTRGVWTAITREVLAEHRVPAPRDPLAGIDAPTVGQVSRLIAGELDDRDEYEGVDRDEYRGADRVGQGVGRDARGADRGRLAFDRAERLEDLLHRRLCAKFASHVSRTHGAIRLLRGPIAGYPVAVTSNLPEDVLGLALHTAGLAGFFATIVGDVPGRVAQPAPDIHLAAAWGLGAEPERVLAIEGCSTGVGAALAARMTVARTDVLTIHPTGLADARARREEHDEAEHRPDPDHARGEPAQAGWAR